MIDSFAAVSGEGNYAAGEQVMISAGIRDGYTFSGWVSDDVTIRNTNALKASFTMPEYAVTVTAVWEKMNDTSQDD